MSAPTNISAGTAIDITTLPYTITQTVDDAGTTYTVWYKYTFAATGVIGIWGFGDLVTYKPTLDIYGPNSSVSHSDIGSAQNLPTQLSGTIGDEYFFKFTTNGGNPTPANLQISVLEAPNDAIIAGSILVNDDTPDFPAVIISPVDGSILKFITPFPAGEQGDSILSGTVYYVVADGNDGSVKVYDQTFLELANLTPSGDGFDALIRANWTLGKIYMISPNGSNNWILQQINSDGSVPADLSTITAGQSSALVNAFCVANDGNLVYITANSPAKIRTWSISGNAFVTDLVAAITGYSINDILVLEDDSILALYIRTSTGSVIVIQYDPTGAVLNTYDFGTSNVHTTFQHITYALDSPDSFWVWTHPTGGSLGLSRFRNILISDGSTVTDLIIPEYETGVYNAAVTGSPLARFGPSLSCPFFLVGAPTGTITVNKVVVGGSEGDSFDFTTDGLTPSTFSLEDGDSQVFSDLPPGIYGIVEDAAEGFTTIYTISNDDPNDAIVITGSESIIVTVTNTAAIPLSGIYKIVPRSRKTNDTVYTSLSPVETTDVEIPDPFFKTGLVGQ